MKIIELLTEGVAGPKSCWPGHRKVGTQPGTGKNKGKRVNDCEKIKKEDVEDLHQEFDLIESIINRLAEHNGVDAEVIWEDLETLTEDELYAFAVTSEPIMEDQGVAEGVSLKQKHEDKKRADQNQVRYGKMTQAEFDKKWTRTERPKPTDKQQGVAEDWQKANKRDKTDGMSQKAVNAYRRENPGSKLKTAVTTKPSKLKKGGKASKRRSSYCSRSRGQMKMHSISCSKTPDKAICKARRRWNC